MSKKKAKFIIIDGNALIHRSFHALPPMTTKDGKMVNAVYGFMAVLLKAIKEFKPEYVALTFDRKEKTFRHKEYADYKATRVKAPDELYEQIPMIKELVSAFKIPIYELAGFEADDLIGTLTKLVDGEVEKIIVTGDMDTLQLVNDHTKVFTMSRGLTDSVIYDAEAVAGRYGLTPEQMIDYKALRGDPSDNIPGVKGIGEKTAVELLKAFGTLENLFKNIHDPKFKILNLKFKIKDRIVNLLLEHENDAYMSKRLATIDCAAPIEFKLDEARFGGYDLEEVGRFFSKFEFKSLLSRLQSIGENEENLENKNIGPGQNASSQFADKFERDIKTFSYNLIDNDKDFENFLKKLKTAKEFTFDTETSTFDPVHAKFLGISFSWEEGRAYYLNFQFPISNVKKDTLFNYQSKDKNTRQEWLEKLKPIFENDKIKKYGHNIKYDIEVMASYDIEVKGITADSMIASYLLNPGSRQHNLDTVTFSELNWQKISKDDLLGKGRDKITFSEVALEKIYIYSCEDADFTNRLVKKLLPELKKEKLDKLFSEMEMPLVNVLVDMEINGIKVNEKFLEAMKKELDKKINGLEKNIHKLAGSEFNINSTQQLREILFEKLKLSTAGISKTKTGLSTGADELAKLKNQHKIIGLIQEYRELAKLMSTYIEALPELVNEKTGRLHTSFNQSVTATGRLSSTEPNLQNIPIRTEMGKEIRKAFIADKGYKLLSLDYSQIELRLAAHMSGDKGMIKAFLDHEDIHRSTAAAINNVDPKDVTKEMRREAKAINFGILYGQGPHGLSQTADIPFARAKEFIEQYYDVFSGVKEYIEGTINEAREKGYTETLYGRKRYLPDINSSVIQIKKAAERMAVNTPIQGSAADIIKAAMIQARELIKSKYKNNEIRMLLQVHDELLFEVKPDLAEKISREIKAIMEGIIKLKVPLEVDIEIGDNWGEL